MTRTKDPFDELAAMFLTEADEPVEAEESDTGRESAKAVMTELLVVAHLPVRGGLWLTPYADAVARTSGPTALLRLDGDHPTFQQLRGEDPTGGPQPDLTLRETIAQLMPSTPTWIIRPAPRTSPTRMLEAGVDRITILTSADDAAVVAAYQVVKNLFDEVDVDTTCVPPIAVAVVGSDTDQAEDMLGRLNATAESHLGISIPMTLCLPRMDAGILSTRYMSFSEEDCPPLAKVVRMIDETRRGVGMSKPVPTPTPTPTPSLVEPENDLTEDDFFETPPVEQHEPTLKIRMPVEDELASEDVEFLPRMPGIVEVLRAQVEDEAVDIDPELARLTEPPRRTVRLKPKPAMEFESKDNLEPHEPAGEAGRPLALAEHVQGLTPILPRCPNHEQVELALDAAGRLHLLTKEEFLRELLIVEPWARTHRELIAMACREHTIDPGAKVIKHVFTAEPIAVSDLHHTDLRLHVLAPVKVKGETAWFAAPLNATGA